MIRVRAYRPEDREFVLSLAPRLLIGKQAWRDDQRWLTAVQGWIKGSIQQHGERTTIFVAEDEQNTLLGFATVTHENHFTGERQASIGELAVSQAAEGLGAGKALVQACEQWARMQGDRLITLATGAGNAQALGFYHHLGYQDEDIKLAKRLTED